MISHFIFYVTDQAKSTRFYESVLGQEPLLNVPGMTEFKLNEEEYTRKPVKARKGIYIIKIIDKTILTETNINDIIDDKKHAERIKSRLLRKYTKEYLDKLFKSNNRDLPFNPSLKPDFENNAKCSFLSSLCH